MVIAFRLVYLWAAVLATASGVLVTASLFIAERAPSSGEFLGISLVVSACFLGVGAVLFGVERHVACIADPTSRGDGEGARQLSTQVSRLLAYLLAGGILVMTVLALATYGILARIDQGFAVFG